ncbi:MAG: TIGR02996 domain-containing protein [Kofleriaceae bacterium]
MASLADLERAVCAAPDDDGPRHALAARLDARGDPRGRFIALQLEVAAVRAAADVRPNQWAERWLAAEDLRRRHGATWTPPLPAGVDAPVFARGFVEQVAAPAALVATPAALFAAAPIRRLHLRDVVDVDALFAQPSLARMVALDFTGCRLGDRGAVALAACPHLTRLRWLDLADNDLGDLGVDALVRSPYLAQLRYCRLAWNRAPSPEEAAGMDGGVAWTEPTALTLAAEAAAGPRPWLRAPSIHRYAYPPAPDDVIGR